MLRIVDLFVRGVGIVGIWIFTALYHTAVWSLDILFKITWTLFLCLIEFWVGLLALVFVVRHFKRD